MYLGINELQRALPMLLYMSVYDEFVCIWMLQGFRSKLYMIVSATLCSTSHRKIYTQIDILHIRTLCLIVTELFVF